MTRQIPVHKGIDQSFQLLTEGYTFLRKRFEEMNSDILELRVMGKKMICMYGKEAASIFYDSNIFQRKGAVPKRIQKSLFGENAIQTMDGTPHKVRKLLFMSLMTEHSMTRLSFIVKEQWERRAEEWEQEGKRHVILFDEAEEVLCRAACIWAGVPLRSTEVKLRAYDFGAMVDAFGGVGPRYQEGKKARKREEGWMETLIEEARFGSLEVAEGTPFHSIIWHRDENGELLHRKMAAIEVINVIRPIVAVSRFVVFGALAFQHYPSYKEHYHSGDDSMKETFIQEVRRYYPFAPFVGAIAKKDVTFKGYLIQKGATVLLDVYGTNHDKRIWDKPEEFNPGRFETRVDDPYDFIPQGGGDYYENHRCPGECATIEVMKASLNFLTDSISYAVPKQDLSINPVRMPTLPESRFILELKR